MDIAVGVRHWVTPRSLAMWQEKLDAISPPKAKIRRPIPSPSVAQRSAPSRGTRASRATWSGSAVHHGTNRLIRLRELTEIILTPHRISAPLSLPGHRTFPTPEGRTLPQASVTSFDHAGHGDLRDADGDWPAITEHPSGLVSAYLSEETQEHGRDAARPHCSRWPPRTRPPRRKRVVSWAEIERLEHDIADISPRSVRSCPERVSFPPPAPTTRTSDRPTRPDVHTAQGTPAPRGVQGSRERL